jgi:hypothetical protein
VAKLDAEMTRDAENERTVKARAEKAAEQPTLDKGIAALPLIVK